MRKFLVLTTLLINFTIVIALAGCIKTEPHPIVEKVYVECTKAVALADAGDVDGFAKSDCATYLTDEVKKYKNHEKLNFPEEVYQQDDLSTQAALKIARDIKNAPGGFRDEFYTKTFLKPVLVFPTVMRAVFFKLYPSEKYKNDCRVAEGSRLLCFEEEMQKTQEKIKRLW